MVLVLLVVACEPVQEAVPDRSLDYDRMASVFRDMAADNPCGLISLGAGIPVYNLSGQVLAETRPNTSVYLKSTGSIAYHQAMWAIKNCGLKLEAKVKNGSFSFRIPPGKYVIYIPTSSYACTQGPPLPSEGNFSVNVSFQGGDSQFMASAFEIQAKSEP
ncbi:MAG: hypothetical protein U5L00_07275 [Desulfovermiculus sp.]|nr:hypothetical protein [Desulfovermiculus sp.]